MQGKGFYIGSRSARNLYKFGLPEESKRPEVVPTKVEVRFIKNMAKIRELWKLSSNGIYYHEKNVLESMRRDLDISIQTRMTIVRLCVLKTQYGTKFNVSC